MAYEVRLGNISPLEAYLLSDPEHARPLGATDDQVKALGETLAAQPEGSEVLFTRRASVANGFEHDNSVTMYAIPSTDYFLDGGKRDRPLREIEAEVLSAFDVYHSQDPPEWVEAWVIDDEDGSRKRFRALERRISENYSVGDHECVIGRPESWEGWDPDSVYGKPEGPERAGPPPIGGGALGTSYMPEEFGEEFRARWREAQLRTNAGTDWQASIMGNSAASGAGTGTQRSADFVALTTDGTAPAGGDTTLASELATDGLSRAAGTYAHTGGTNTYTITRAFTFTRAGGVDRNVQKIGVFNAGSVGTMAFETLLTAAQLLQANGDQLTVTQTVTL